MQPPAGDQPFDGTPHVPDFTERFAEIFRVDVPPWFDLMVVVGLTFLGIVAFGITGFSGYSYQSGWMGSAVFHKPSVLFAFGCLLFLTLQRLILLHPTGTKQSQESSVIVKPFQPTAALIATLCSIALIVIVDLAPHQVNQFLDAIRQLLQLNNVLQAILVLINMYFLIVVLIDFLVGWIPDVVRIIANWQDRVARTQLFAKFLSKFVNDTFAAAILAVALAVIFQAQVFLGLYQAFYAVAHTGLSLLGTTPPINDCTLSLYAACGTLPAHYNPNQLPTLTYFDVLVAGAMGFLGIVSFAGYLAGGLLVLNRGRPQSETVIEAILHLEIRNALLFAFEAVITPLRRALWPAFVFVGVLCVAIAAKMCQLYLQLLSCQHQAQFGSLPASLVGNPDCVPAWFDVTGKGYAYLGAALALAVGAAIMVVVAAVVQLYTPGKPAESGRQVAGYWLLRLFFLGWTVLIPFGIASIALLLLNLILLPATIAALPQAFFPPGVVSYVAFIALIYAFVVYVYLRRRNDPGANAAGPNAADPNTGAVQPGGSTA